ncbi:SRPBCC family protein [uncultured Tateyamaria sp.]|uniref:SRPBCC family protein n=1 Tax=uncultured Tateyamaria sp. TaxID=455651 RepID=UPI00262E3C8C|nr:SRPBCC family protein [uncultured Tateyamaria sp.]
MRTVLLTHHYDAPARDVWDIAIDYDCLSEVMQGLVTFDGLPTGRVMPGQSLTVMVSLFGLLPAQPYHMDVVAFDDAAMRLTSSERGAGVKSWRHTLVVEATETGCTLTDRIEIDAGWMTWAFARWARFLYRRRHGPRLRILARRHKGTVQP